MCGKKCHLRSTLQKIQSNSLQCTLHSFSLRGLLKVIKVYFCSNLHQIWWKGAFLQVIEGSFIIFPISLFWAPHLTPRRGRGVKWGRKSFLLQSSPNLVRWSFFMSNWRIFDNFYDFCILNSPFDPHNGSGGSKWGQLGVKSRFCSNVTQI